MVRKLVTAVGCCLLACTAQALGDDLPRPNAHGEGAVAYAPDGKWLVTGGSDGNLRIRDGTTGAVRATLAGHKAGVHVNAVAVSPDGRTIASASNDLSARLWDVERRAERRVLLIPVNPIKREYRFCVLAIAFAPDGRTVATGDSGGFIRLWDVESGALRESWRGDAKSVDQLVYSPDGATIASVGNDTAVKLWDARTHTLRRSLPQPGQTRLHIAYAPDGKTLAASRDFDIVLWNPATGARKDSFQAGIECAPSLAFTPDGASLAAGGVTGLSHLCSVKAGKDGDDRCSILFYPPHPLFIFSVAVAVSPDGRWVAHGFNKITEQIPNPSFKLIAIR